MKVSSVWKRNNTRKKKNRSTFRPKIRWELLGLSDPDVIEPTAIDTIRKTVSSLASQGLGESTKSRSREQATSGRGNRESGGKRVRRRGATE